MSMLPADIHRRLEAPVSPSRPPDYITVTRGISGFFAVQMTWNDKSIQLGGFWEPWTTGFGRYHERSAAVEEAKVWAEAEGLEYKGY